MGKDKSPRHLYSTGFIILGINEKNNLTIVEFSTQDGSRSWLTPLEIEERFGIDIEERIKTWEAQQYEAKINPGV